MSSFGFCMVFHNCIMWPTRLLFPQTFNQVWKNTNTRGYMSSEVHHGCKIPFQTVEIGFIFFVFLSHFTEWGYPGSEFQNQPPMNL